MVVIALFAWEPPDGLSVPNANDAVQRKIEILGGKLIGKWDVDYEVYQSAGNFGLMSEIANSGGATQIGAAQSATGGQQSIHILHCCNYNQSTFAVLEDNTVLTADTSFDQIIQTMKSFYPKKGQKCDARGNKYELQDNFIIKAGHGTHGTGQKILLIEIAYMKCDYYNECWEKITGIAKVLLDNAIQLPIEMPPTIRKDTKFKAEDLILMYKKMFIQLKKPSAK